MKFYMSCKGQTSVTEEMEKRNSRKAILLKSVRQYKCAGNMRYLG